MQPWENQGPVRSQEQTTRKFGSSVAKKGPLRVLNYLSDTKGYRSPKNDVHDRYEQDGPAERPPLIGFMCELLLV